MILKKVGINFYFNKNFINNTYIYNILPKNEFYWVLSWIKKIWIKDMDKLNLDEDIKNNNLEKLKLYLSENKVFYKIVNISNEYFGKNKNLIFYSKDNVLLNYVYDSFVKNKNNNKIALLFWYPSCCTNREKWYKNNDCNFLLNDMTAYESIPTDYLDSNINWKINYYYKYFSWWLITWDPCSYICNNSIKKALFLLKFIKKIDIKFYQFIFSRITKNVLYFDKWNWISFNEQLTSTKNSINIYEWIISNKKIQNDIKNKYNYLIKNNILFIYNGFLEVNRYNLDKECKYYNFNKNLCQI